MKSRAAAAAIDQHRSRLHPSEQVCIHDVPGIVAKLHVDAQDVGTRGNVAGRRRQFDFHHARRRLYTEVSGFLVADRPEGPFGPLGPGSQTPRDWMALDGTLAVEDGVPYMVFAREWIQVEDGTIELMPLTPDLARAAAPPATMFRASDAPWTRCRGDLGELFQGRRYHASVTDGPWLHRTKTGTLIMLWSSYGPIWVTWWLGDMVSALPVRISNFAPCRGQAIAYVSHNLPSASGPPSCVQTSSIA